MGGVMKQSHGQAQVQRRQLLEMLRAFEDAVEQVHPEIKQAETPANVARFRDAAQALRTHLSKYRALKETLDWPNLPDSDAEISAFAEQLKAEHQELLGELDGVIREAEQVETAMDRAHAAARLRDRSRGLVLRIARHAGEEEAPLGNYS